MLRVFRWDGKEMFINPDLVALVELTHDLSQTEVTLINGKTVSLSLPSYEALTGVPTKKAGPGKAGFDVY